MPVMIKGTNNLKEEMAGIKAMLERLVKEREEKEPRIKLQEEKIVRLPRKLEKWPARSLYKSSKSEEERAPVQSEAFNEEVIAKRGSKLKNGGPPSLMTVEQIQDLIANAVEAQLGGVTRKTHLHTKPCIRRVEALRMPRGYQPLRF